jgi:hypothetical protein
MACRGRPYCLWEVPIGTSDRWKPRAGGGPTNQPSHVRLRRPARAIKACGTRCPHCILDALGSVDQIVVLPNDQQPPPCLRQGGFVALIALDVPFQLRHPVLDVRFGQNRVLWTKMPKAPPDLDGDARLREDDVGTAAQSRNDAAVLPKAQSAPMQETAQSDLGLGVARPVSAHYGAGPRRRCLRSGRHPSPTRPGSDTTGSSRRTAEPWQGQAPEGLVSTHRRSEAACRDGGAPWR